MIEMAVIKELPSRKKKKKKEIKSSMITIWNDYRSLKQKSRNWRATAFFRGRRLIVSSRQRRNTKGFKHIVKTLLSITFMHSKRGTPPLPDPGLEPTIHWRESNFIWRLPLFPRTLKS